MLAENDRHFMAFNGHRICKVLYRGVLSVHLIKFHLAVVFLMGKKHTCDHLFIS